MTTIDNVRERFRTDAATRGSYVSDASIFRRYPRAVFEPETVEDIAAALTLAREYGWPIIVRGGGTSVAGNSIGEGLVLDTSRHFNRILDIDADRGTARVQPGVICDDLRRAAAAYDLTYGPDPSTHSRCTIGGMIANNACGSHSLQWGTAADNLVELRVMTAEGKIVTLRRDGSDDPELNQRLGGIRDDHLRAFRTELGQFPRLVSGFGLHYLLSENGFHTARAFAGSEGTCGIIVEAVVRLVPAPPATAIAVLAFPSIFDAATAAARLRHSGIATAEGMGGDLLDAFVNNQGDRARFPALPGVGPNGCVAGGWLYCETAGSTAEEARQKANHLVEVAEADTTYELVDSLVVTDPDRARELWSVREAAAGLATRLPDGSEAWPSWEDSAVPPEHLADYLRSLYSLLDEHGLRGVPFGHFGEGCIHIRISFDFTTEEGIVRFRDFMTAAARVVASFGGSLSGEHGDGRARSELLPTIFTPEILEAFADFKRAFDPDGRFNPGVIVDPEPIDRAIRPGPGQLTHDFIPIHALSKDSGSMVNAVNRCVGVGLCRSDDDAMCPSFQITRDEVHSTRGRARLLSEMFRGETITDGTDSTAVKDALDLCLSCHACASECPVNVDMSKYKAEFLNQHYRHRRRPVAHHSMGRLPQLGHLLHLIPGAASAVNALLSIPVVENLVMRAGGVDSSRSMVRFSERSFQSMMQAGRRNRKPKGRSPLSRTASAATNAGTVVLWPDSFSNHLDTDVAVAAHEVLRGLGYDVVVPRGFVCCGLTLHSTGQLDAARTIITSTLQRLEPHIDGQTPVVVLEPSCASMLSEEAPELLVDDPRAPALAGQIVTLGELVMSHSVRDDIADPWPFAQVEAIALSQVHCHERSRRAHDPTTEALSRLGIEESTISTGCCGLAGNWGFEPGHAQMSRDLAERELLPRIRDLDEDALVLADGYSCRTQIREGLAAGSKPKSISPSKRGMHLAQVLHRAMFGRQEHGAP